MHRKITADKEFLCKHLALGYDGHFIAEIRIDVILSKKLCFLFRNELSYFAYSCIKVRETG